MSKKSLYSKVKVVLKDAYLFYPSIFQKGNTAMDGEPEKLDYNTSFQMTEESYKKNMVNINKALDIIKNNIGAELFNTIKEKDKIASLPSKKKKDDKFYKTSTIKAKGEKPLIVDSLKREISEEEAGDIRGANVNAVVYFYYYNKMGGGITSKLKTIQLTGKEGLLPQLDNGLDDLDALTSNEDITKPNSNEEINVSDLGL